MWSWLVETLKWRIAREELETLERYRRACSQVEQWNASLPASTRTAEYIEKVGEGKAPADIQKFRDSLGWDYGSHSFVTEKKPAGIIASLE